MTLDPRNPTNDQLRILAQLGSFVRVYDKKVLDGNAAIAAGKVYRAAELCGHLTTMTYDLLTLWDTLPDRPAWEPTHVLNHGLRVGPSAELRELIATFEAAPVNETDY